MWNRNALLRAGTAALALGLPQQAAAVLVYVTSYAGTLTSLNLTLSAAPWSNATNATTHAGPKATITSLAVNDGCAPQASWLTLDKPNGILYCLDESFGNPNGSLSSYQTSANGTLTQLKRVKTPSGPVYATIYGAGGRGLAVADYQGSSFSTYLKDPRSLATVEQVTWTLPHPGANATRQDASHPHEVVLDPTGKFFLVPDLGADLVRVFLINQTDLTWAPVTPLVTPPGSGPRHVSFVVASNRTYMYLTSELANTLTGYQLTYHANNTLSFTQIYLSSSHGLGQVPVPAAATAAEVLTSPDHRFVIVSTRSDHTFNITNFDPKNSTQLVSDSIATFKVNPANGNLTFVQLYPAGGLIPRQFTINKAGTLLGVGQQGSARAVFINRDVKSGKLTGFAGAVDIAGEVTSVLFDE
ncbi:YkgB protein [Niveomyces insectorum RCEF 264]|uniref:YkgB protein n=1 Tax=Niveomyces insectorum RCEF 264 TaxID=1081102 RepID=A0A162KC80_9HYPO|nr:YkgB protein [Niveomyces insectorum RCEF 264]